MLKRHFNLAEDLLDDPVPSPGRLCAKTVRVFIITRWPNTGAASHFTSFGRPYSRPSSSAIAFTARDSAWEPRGLTPIRQEVLQTPDRRWRYKLAHGLFPNRNQGGDRTNSTRYHS